MTLIKKPTKVTLEGVGALTLRPADYVTQGGEGAIYKKNDRIIKLYLDPKKMKADGMSEKVRVLAKTMQHDSIVAPKGVVLGSKNQPVGYHMPFVSGEPYPRLFTNDMRNQTGLNDEGISFLTNKMHEVVQYTHDQKALMVDANELNWLADVRDVQKPIPYVIDVDSWAIDRWKASVIMPSIRDWHSSGFSPETDWFAWGIVSFLLYTGIHPYKGKLSTYKPGELERRMKDNASVFLPDVRLNRAVRDFSCIPGPLLDWYQETFTNGHRGTPPSPMLSGNAKTALGRVMRTIATTTGGLVYEQLLNITNDPVVSVWPCGVVRTASGDLYQVVSKRKIGHSDAQRLAVVSHDDGWILAEEIAGRWSFSFLTRNSQSYDLSMPIAITGVVRSNERLFVTTDTELIELRVQMFKKPLLTTEKRWQIMGNATRWYQGVGVSDVLGATYLVTPFGDDSVSFVKAPELDGLRVISAVAGTRFVEVMTIDQNGDYKAFAFSFDATWHSYQVTTRDCDSPEQNLTVLDKGVTALIAEDGEITVAVPFKGVQKVVSDKDLFTTMRLSHIGDKVVYRYNDSLWSLRMQ